MINKRVLWRVMPALLLVGLAGAFLAGCGGGDDDDEPAATATKADEPTQAPADTPTSADQPTQQPTATSEPAAPGDSLTIAQASPAIDGDSSDWASIAGVALDLKQFEIPAGVDWEIDGEVAPKAGVLKVASDGANIYVLVEVEDSFDYVADDHGLSPALAVMFTIDSAAGPHMGSGADDFATGLGMVDIWHWELDCAAGAASGGGDPGSGDDPDCNLDDEYATDPETREDDDQAGAENSIAGAWSHTATSAGADGTWIFEMSRPLDTGDPTDAQFAAGGAVSIAIAYWDPKETAGGWSDAGHLTSADMGWITGTLP